MKTTEELLTIRTKESFKQKQEIEQLRGHITDMDEYIASVERRERLAWVVTFMVIVGGGILWMLS